MIFLILPILIVTSMVSLIVRALFGGFGFRHRHPRGSWINGSGYGNSFGQQQGYGSGRRHGLGGPLMSLLALVALERLFTRRW